LHGQNLRKHPEPWSEKIRRAAYRKHLEPMVTRSLVRSNSSALSV
jgi:hypothetical protein